MQRFSLQEKKDIFSDIWETQNSYICHLSSQQEDVVLHHCHFRTFTTKILNLQSEHSKRKNACTELKLGLEQRKIVREVLWSYFAHHLSTSCTISSPPNQARNRLEWHAHRLSRRRHCCTDAHCAPLKSSGHGFTSVIVQVISAVALENLQNELRSDLASALATQCTRTAAAFVAHSLLRAVAFLKYFFTANHCFVLAFVLILNSTNWKIWKERPWFYRESLFIVYSIFLFTKFAALIG